MSEGIVRRDPGCSEGGDKYEQEDKQAHHRGLAAQEPRQELALAAARWLGAAVGFGQRAAFRRA